MTITASPARAGGARPAAGLARAALIALLAFLTVVDLFATQAILPALATAYGESPARTGLAVNASTIGMAAASLAMAAFGRRVDRRLGIAIALAALAAPTLLLAVAPGLGSFAVLRVAQGLCMATAFTLTLAWLGETSAPGAAAGAFAAYITGNVASNLFGRLMSAAVTDHFGVSTNFIVFAGLNLAGAALALAVVARGAPAQDRGRSFLSSIGGHLANPPLAATFAVGFMILFAFIGTFTYVNFVLVAPPIGLGMMAVGLVYLVFLPSIVTTPMAGLAVSRIGPRRALWAGLLTAVAGLPLLLAGTLAAMAAGLALVGVGTFFAQAVATGFVGRAATGDKGGASGLYLASYFSGGLAGTAAVGAAFEASGWHGAVGLVGAALVAAAMLGTMMRARG